MSKSFLAVAAAASIALATAAAAEQMQYFDLSDPDFITSAKLGKQMFEAYQCALCHATGEGQELTEDIIAPNLILSKHRLRPEWIVRWLIDPQELQPGTKMPNFFSFNEDDDWNPIYADADAHMQYKIILALRDYLMVLGTDIETELSD
jgi:hypothetical protein